jgi:ABC-type transport system involved in multi-copper enzyme maturation permease subunit
MKARLAPALAIVGYGWRESLRRRVFVVILVLTLGFLTLYGVGAHFAFRDVKTFAGEGALARIDPVAVTGGTLFGLAMFASLFLGAVLAVFLTLGVVRGDAESGLLQPLVVRPVGRGTTLMARFAGAAGVAAAFEIVLYLVAVLITSAIGGWTPDHLLGPGLGLAFAVVVIAALSLLGSVFLAGTAQGIALFMVFGMGLTAGLLGQIGRALGSGTLKAISHDASWALPFEALYQAGLHSLTSSTTGFTGAAIKLGPFGGADAAGFGLVCFALAYVAAVLAIAIALFRRRDL